MTRPQPLREQIVAAAILRTTRDGWASVTMAQLAGDVGVSRQTVYTEVGSKPALAEAMVLTELGRFLTVVDDAFAQHPRSLHAAVRTAVHDVLSMAAENELLRAVLAATAGGDTELLPSLTTRSTPVLDLARAALGQRLAPFAAGVGRREQAAATDAIVRVVLGHVMQPSGTPAGTAQDVAWMAGRLLAAPS